MPYDDTTRQDLPIYVVMESSFLIADDICGALRALGPCQVIKIADTAVLSALVAGDLVITAAVLEMTFAQALRMALADTCILRGAKIVLTVGGCDAAIERHGWSMLERPFTEDMLHAALKPLLRDA